jgi:hypothetical protein
MQKKYYRRTGALVSIQLCLLLVGCGPSAEEQAATSVPMTATAATETPTDTPTPTAIPGVEIALSSFDSRFSAKLVTFEEMIGFDPADPSEQRWEDGICRIFMPTGGNAQIYGRVLNCIFETSSSYDLQIMREHYADDVSLKSQVEFNFEDEWEFYAYVDVYDCLKFSLLLEKDGYLYNAAVLTPGLPEDRPIEEVLEVIMSGGLFNDEYAPMVYIILTMNLEKAQTSADSP